MPASHSLQRAHDTSQLYDIQNYIHCANQCLGTDAERASLRDAVLREGMRMHAYQLQTQYVQRNE